MVATDMITYIIWVFFWVRIHIYYILVTFWLQYLVFAKRASWAMFMNKDTETIQINIFTPKGVCIAFSDNDLYCKDCIRLLC